MHDCDVHYTNIFTEYSNEVGVPNPENIYILGDHGPLQLQTTHQLELEEDSTPLK